MRIAIDATPLLGPVTGVGVFARGAARGLAARDGTDVVGYALSLRGARRLPDVLPDGVTPCTRPMPAGALLRAWSTAPVPPAELWLGEVDVVHGTNYVVPPARRAAAVATVHDLTAVRYPELCLPASLRYPDLVKKAVARGAWVHAVSQSTADETVELLGVPRERVRVVWPGLDPQPRGDAAAGRDAVGTDRYVLAVGTIEPRKGFDRLVRAFAALDGDVALVIAGGDGWGADAVRAAIAASPARERIRLVGWVDDQRRADLLAGAAVVAVPSVYEGFGYPVIEAMAQGAPVVASSAGSLAEIAGGAAIMVEDGEDALGDALCRVLADRDLAAGLAERGRENVARFTWDRCTDGLLALYRDAMAAR